MTNTNEKTLIDKAKKGDIESFEKLISNYKENLISFVYLFSGNYSEAIKMSQDILINIHTNLKNFKKNDDFFKFLFSSAVTYCIEISKSNNHNEQSRQQDDDFMTVYGSKIYHSKDNEDFNKDILVSIYSSLQSLNYEEKIILVLRDVFDISIDDISEMLKMPIETVKTKMSRANKNFRAFLLG